MNFRNCLVSCQMWFIKGQMSHEHLLYSAHFAGSFQISLWTDMKVKIFSWPLTNILAFLTFKFCGKQNELIKQLQLTMHTSNRPANNIMGFYCLNDEGILSESGAETKLWGICFFYYTSLRECLKRREIWKLSCQSVLCQMSWHFRYNAGVRLNARFVLLGMERLVISNRGLLTRSTV